MADIYSPSGTGSTVAAIEALQAALTSASTPTSVNVSKVNGTTTSTGTGTVDAGTQRVVLASNGPTVAVGAAGDVAHDGVDAGNPVKIGGKASTSTPTSVSAADRVDAWFDARGSFVITTGASNPGDGVAGLASILTIGGGNNPLAAQGYLFNGTSSDRQRNNHEVTVLASAARTASVNSSDLTNYNARGAIVVVDVTAGGGAGSITVTIKGKCSLSGKYSTILASAAITATGTTVLRVSPGITAAANLAVADLLPRLWRVEVVAADATSYTYSISANYVG